MSLLHPYASDGTVQPPSPCLTESKKQVEVDRLLYYRDRKLRRKGSKREFLERWLGYGPEHNSWEPESTVQRCQQSLSFCWKSLASQRSSHGKDVMGQSATQEQVWNRAQCVFVKVCEFECHTCFGTNLSFQHF